MIDREKVIKGLEHCMIMCEGVPHNPCHGCEYLGSYDCADRLKADALALLKEQETEWEHLWDAPDGTFKGRCKNCGFVHFFIEGHDTQYKFCPECGRKVKWE